MLGALGLVGMIPRKLKGWEGVLAEQESDGGDDRFYMCVYCLIIKLSTTPTYGTYVPYVL